MYPGINVEAIRKQLREDEERTVLNDVVMTNLATAEENLSTMRATTMAQILECIQERFKDFEGNPFFANATVFDPSSWPAEKLQEYGNEKLNFLLDHFKAVSLSHGCYLEKAKQEWQAMKLFVSQHQHLQNLS